MNNDMPTNNSSSNIEYYNEYCKKFHKNRIDTATRVLDKLYNNRDTEIDFTPEELEICKQAVHYYIKETS
jgi:hypothetical protein